MHMSESEAQIARLFAEIDKIGLKQIDGQPSAVSQYGIQYAQWHMGWKPEGLDMQPIAAAIDSLASAVNHAIRDMTVAREAGAAAVVWRTKPYWLFNEPGSPRPFSLRFRCHFLDVIPQ